MYYFSSIRSTDKPKLQNDVSVLLDKASFEGGAPVYKELTDRGCDDKNAVGLQVYIHCEIVAFKLSKAPSPGKIDLHQVDESLLADGWKHARDPSGMDDLKHVDPSSSEYQDVQYLRGDLGLGIDVVMLKEGDYLRNDTPIRDLITQGSLAQPAPGESIYGVRITATYWTCEGSAFLNPCTAPPSKPE